MKKIMFNDSIGLTQAVLSGRKMQTRRIIKFSPIDAKYVYDEGWSIGGYVVSEIINHYPRYKVGEIVAVAQAYRDIAHPNDGFLDERYEVKDEFAAGWTNKMFVKADLMPNHIRITDVKVERLQEISDVDCLREGIMEGEFMNTWDRYYFDIIGDDVCHKTFKTPREAFAALIDKVSGNGTWNSNPWVFVYEFELID